MTCPTGDALVVGADGVVLDLRGLTITGPGAYAPGTGAGVRVPQRAGVTVLGVVVRGTGTGVVLDQGSGHRVSRVVVEAADRGIQVSNSADALVDRNRVSGSGRDAVLISGGGATGARVLQNELSDNVFGAFVSSGATGALVDRNSVVRTRGPGIAVFGGAAGTTIRRNAVSGGGGDGVQVSGDAVDTRVVQNTLTGNAGDGLQVDAPGTVVAQDTAHLNGELGIEAVEGTVDGGGSTASGNGDPRQCVGVVCSSG